jgi:hypothetical protein
MNKKITLAEFYKLFQSIDRKTKINFILSFLFFFTVFATPLLAQLGYTLVVIPNTKEVLNAKLVRVERTNFNSNKITNSYRYYTDRGVYTNQDLTAIWKFNSADVHSQFIQNEGKTCTITVHGVRNEFFSVFKDLSKIENCR